MLARPVDGASLAVLRICLGVVMVLEAVSLCQPNRAALSYGTTPLETYYTGQGITFHFPFEGLDWLPLAPPWGIHLIVGIQIVAGILMALGLFYRAAAAGVFLSWGYLWVVESTRTYWQSHYYLEVLLTFLMIWMPAARCWSLDARRAKAGAGRMVPHWTVFLLRMQLVIAYFYAGVAKLTSDWLLDAMPVRWFLAEPGVTEPYRRFLSAEAFESFVGFVHSAGFAFFLSYTGLLFDLAVGFLLLVRRTRMFALAAMLVFHALNHLLIFDDIDWFPLVGAASALIFLDPDWPRRMAAWLRQPRFVKPDWQWCVPGAVLFPPIGALLGWSLKPTAPGIKAGGEQRIARWTPWFVALWIVWQVLIPLRHHVIPGDGRFTYEGMSFSWRLKAEVREAYVHELYLRDAGLITRAENGQARIDWGNWRGEQVIYRVVAPGAIDWAQLPEIVVLLEPMLGERIVFNPMASQPPVRSEAEARARVNQIWRELHGRAPARIQSAGSLAGVLEALAGGLKDGGSREEGNALAGWAAQLGRLDSQATEAKQLRGLVRALLGALIARDAGNQIVPLLRTTGPFALTGGQKPAAPFLMVEDPKLIDPKTWRIAAEAWKPGAGTRGLRDEALTNVNSTPLVICLDEIAGEAAAMLPQACVLDVLAQPKELPRIWWNSSRDMPPSKVLHTSAQAFYLRRYARRVAALWERQHGRRPQVNAKTAVSLNGRPHQPLVDPEADLASVPSRWFGHNPWIRDLEMKRIPPGVPAQPPWLR